VLTYTLGGRNISEVLDMSVEQAREFFADVDAAAGKPSGPNAASGKPPTLRPVRAMLTGLADVGLPYLTLGQPLTTLSGGERQRLKLAIEMAKPAQVYVLDEPTSGLHMNDVDGLITLLDRLVDDGNTIIVIEHNLDVVARADWVIDLGPGAGHDGGRVVFEGSPAQLIDASGSITGQHLRRRAGAA
jgi:excinuclease UvrABC ATPase subunit